MFGFYIKTGEMVTRFKPCINALTLMLRLMGEKVPGVYGPSADEGL